MACVPTAEIKENMETRVPSDIHPPLVNSIKFFKTFKYYKVFTFGFQVKDIVHQFCPTMDMYKRIFEAMEKEMEAGLSKKTHDMATIKMYPSYVTQLPNGIFIAVTCKYSGLKTLVCSSFVRPRGGSASCSRLGRHQLQSTPCHSRAQSASCYRLGDV